MNRLDEILNIPHFKDETLKKIENNRSKELSLTAVFNSFQNEKKDSSYSHLVDVSAEVKAFNFIAVNLAKTCSRLYNHEDVLPWKSNSLLFDYFKIFENSPLFINDESILIKINFKNHEIKFINSCKSSEISGTLLLDKTLAPTLRLMAEDFLKDKDSSFKITVTLLNPDSLVAALRLDDGSMWEEIFQTSLKINSMVDPVNSLPSDVKIYLDQYNVTKELDYFYLIKTVLNSGSSFL